MNNPMDKQWVPWALSGCGLLSLVCFVLIASIAISTASDSQQGTPTPTPANVNGRAVTATVQSVQGAVGVQVGQQCSFNVERHPHPTQEYWCRAQVVCGGALLYGGESAGFFPCQWDIHGPGSIVGADLQTTSQDTDAALGLNSAQRTLIIQDDAAGRHGEFRVQAHITGVR